jgi:hypothetical protein
MADHPDHDCDALFDEAQGTDMDSFAAYDASTFRDGHHPDATTIFGSGRGLFVGVDAIMEALAGHFAAREATWRWRELHRWVDCPRTALIVYETWYELPSQQFSSHRLTSVVYVQRDGRWLAIHDQGTPIAEPASG